MKYRYYLLATQHNKDNSQFVKNCEVHIEDIGINVKISFITDKEPMKRNIDKIIQLFENTRNNENLSTYYTDVQLMKVEKVKENKKTKKETDFERDI